MNSKILKLQEMQFGGMHQFHTERTAILMEAIYNTYGDEAINLIEKSDVDFYGLFRWHIERTLSLVDILYKAYGQTAIDIILHGESESRREEGKRMANSLGYNSLEAIIPLFSDGKSENIMNKTDDMALLKSTGCLVGKIAYELDRKDTLYSLHCNCDQDFVEGFNCNLRCEVVQTIMDGHECCIHKIYKKEDTN